MSLLATLVLAASASTATLPNCSWDRPGVNPFMGDVVAAVDRYRDIPAATRAKLKARLKDRAYDEIAVIHRDGISGQAQYGAEIRDMHFGRGSVCRSVTRAKWSAQHQERGLVYCEDGQCRDRADQLRAGGRAQRPGTGVGAYPPAGSRHRWRHTAQLAAHRWRAAAAPRSAALAGRHAAGARARCLADHGAGLGGAAAAPPARAAQRLSKLAR